jgi:predicted nucleic acid-binding protein
MRRQVILDTGPLVAFLNRRDTYHKWARLQWAQIEPPFLSCEPVLSDACFLLRGLEGGQDAVLELLRRKIVETPFRLADNLDAIARSLKKYSDVGISLADACLVRMAELHAKSAVLTLDAHFNIYRKAGRQAIPTLSPPRE